MDREAELQELVESPFLDAGETTLDYYKPQVIPVIWQTGRPLHPSFKEGLKAFYHRTPFFELSNLGQLYGSDIDALLRQAAKKNHINWAVVIAMGNVFPSQNRIVQEVEEFISSLETDVLVCGHLIDKPGFYCGVHEQFFLVNLRTYERLGCPPFGGYRQGKKILQDYEAGESIHDNYTPKFLNPKPSRSEYSTGTCGWGFVDASLRAGLPVFNLSAGIRKNKAYVYPDDQNEKLNRNIDLIYQLEDLRNPTQRAVLMHLIGKRLNLTGSGGGSGTMGYSERENCLFFFNTEFLLPDEDWNPGFERAMDVYAGPCSGLQDVAFCRVVGIHDETEVIYYDLFDKAIEMKKFMLDHFSGKVRDLPALIARMRQRFAENEVYTGPVEFKIKELLYHFDKSEEEFERFWLRFKALKKTFVKVDMLSEYRNLTARFAENHIIVLNLTDIYLGQNEIVRGMHKMRECFAGLQSECARFPNLYLTGQSLNQNRFFELARDLDIATV